MLKESIILDFFRLFKRAIDNYERSVNIQDRAVTVQEKLFDLEKKKYFDSLPPINYVPTEAEILLFKESKIKAIKSYRERTGRTLAESKLTLESCFPINKD